MPGSPESPNWDTLPPMPQSRVATRKPIIVGHQGAGGLAPGNTLAAFQLAADLGADGVEFDVHRTADGHLIVIHDASVDRTTNGTGLVADLTLDEIKTLDAGSTFDPRFHGERIPTLHELFDFLKQTDLLIFPEIKDPWRYLGIESDIAELIRAYDLVERIQVRSFHHPALHTLYWLAPEIPISELWNDHLPADHEVNFKTINARYTLYTPEHIAQIHRRGQQATAWTVNDPDIARQLVAAGIDGLTTDYPDRLLPVVDI
jgi:glycerophosphoryl diester phosphodiesterase